MADVNAATRRRQWILAGGLAAAVTAVAGGVVLFGKHGAEPATAPAGPAPDMTGLVTSSFTEGISASVLTQQQEKTAALESTLAQMKEEQARQKADDAHKIDQLTGAVADLTAQLGKTGPGQNVQTEQPPAGPMSAGQARPPQWGVTNPVPQGAQGPGGYGQPDANQGSGFYPQGKGGVGSGARVTGGLKSSSFSYKSLSKQTRLPWIPSGSFSDALMIEGADANASVTGSQNTSAVVFTLMGNVSMPNGKTYDMDQCRVTAEIWGDISSERGEVRTKNISCILKNGKHIDMPFEGHAAYQGKQGIRGKPVMRNGKIIGYAGAAGLLSGFGEGIQSAATPSVGIGATASVGAGDIFKQGIGGGASKAADTLSQYWIKRAEQYHPVIDIGAGNRVTIVFQQGFRLETIEDVEAREEKEKAQQNAVPDAAEQVAGKAGNAVGNINPDEVLRQASQLKLGDAIN